MKSTALTTAVEADSVIVSMTRASMALAEAKTIQQTKKVLDVAAAAEIYARRQKLGEEAEDLAASIKVEALRKLGEMLQAAPKAKGEILRGTQMAPRGNQAPTLAELGLTKKESAVAQKLAALPESEFAQVRDGHVTVAKAIAAVDATKQTKPAARQTPAQAEAARIADEAHGDFDPVAALEEAAKEIETLTADLKAAEADDLKAEAIKWRRISEAAQREQSRYMDLCDQAKKREAWNARQLARCGKAIGEADPEKIAAAVEAFARAHTKAAA